jgi:hypothetical protein
MEKNKKAFKERLILLCADGLIHVKKKKDKYVVKRITNLHNAIAVEVPDTKSKWITMLSQH